MSTYYICGIERKKKRICDDRTRNTYKYGEFRELLNSEHSYIVNKHNHP